MRRRGGADGAALVLLRDNVDQVANAVALVAPAPHDNTGMVAHSTDLVSNLSFLRGRVRRL